jgi:hypothetical protein
MSASFVVEELDGRWMGRQDRSAGLSKLAAIFDEHFSKNATTMLPSTSSSSSSNSSTASTSANNSSGSSSSSSTNKDVVRKAATVEGIALGIAGDTAPNVLWRLMHGEMPKYLNPKVWWLSLGNNDLARTEVRFSFVSVTAVDDFGVMKRES